MSLPAHVASRSCRFPLLASLIALLWLSALTAHAGSYSAPVYSGGTFYGQGYQGPGTQPFGPVSTSTGPGWGGGSGGVPSATAGGAITATFTWQPAYGKTMATDPPPSHILVIETSSASGTALCAPATVPGTVSCNDGIGPNGAVSTTTYPGYSVTTSSCQDVRKTLMSNKQTVTVTCSPQVSATGNQSASSASVSYSVSIQLDNRVVTISSPIETSYYKTNNPETLGRDPHIRNVDGSMIVDSAVTLNTGILGGGGYHADVTYTANPLNFNETEGYTWKHPSGSSGEGFQYGQSITVHYDWNASVGSALGSSSVTNVTVSDSDGATSSNIYTVYWHYPYESWQPDGKAFQNAPKAYHSTDGPQGANGQVHIPVTSAGIDWSIPSKIGGGFLTAGTTAIGVLAPETDPLILGFLSATGYSLSVVNPPPAPTTYSQQGTLSQFQSDISTELAIASGSTSGVFLPTVARMDPNFARKATGNASQYFSGPGGTLSFDATAYRVQWQQNYTGDSYNTNGYAGPASGLVHYEGQWQYVFNWIWAANTGPGH